MGFWPSERITKAHERDRIIPKYGYHLGLECTDCGAYNGFIQQTDEMLLVKFYAQEKEVTNRTSKLPL